MERVCKVCDKQCSSEFPDPCIGELPGVNFACCGHGGRLGYISFTNGVAVTLIPYMRYIKTILK